jgi:hypothetical protein
MRGSVSSHRFALPLLGALLACVSPCSCASQQPSTRGAFLEEFEGFPIYHGEPSRPYRLLGAVYSTEAARRGISPMKRAAVAEARRRGADAIIVGVAFDEPTSPSPHAKWQHAVAIKWK